jgi:hypothetical protein
VAEEPAGEAPADAVVAGGASATAKGHRTVTEPAHRATARAIPTVCFSVADLSSGPLGSQETRAKAATTNAAIALRSKRLRGPIRLLCASGDSGPAMS